MAEQFRRRPLPGFRTPGMARTRITESWCDGRNIDVAQRWRLGDRLVNADNNDFAPRIGIAWNPSEKWVVRTGAGMFYAQDTGNAALRYELATLPAASVRKP